MRQLFKSIFRFLPVQLFLLHFRKYQFFLLFWILLGLIITGRFAAVFGAATLFLSPEYLGKTNFRGMFVLGGAMAVFIMCWHITTFIINNTRIPYIGAIRFAFIKYCINNSLLPLIFLIFYTITSVRFQLLDEQATWGHILRMQAGFYCGLVIVILISFAYFFRVGRDPLKDVVGKIANPSFIRSIIPYDTLDRESDLIKADSFITGRLRIRKFSDEGSYHPRMLHHVLQKHSRNAITATIFAIIILLLLGLMSETTWLRVPAAASFLLLFAVVMGLVGSLKYFLRSWELLGWLTMISLLAFLVNERVVDLRSIAYGLNYKSTTQRPQYSHEYLRHIFNATQYQKDKQGELERLQKWASLHADSTGKPPLVIIAVSGGGSRAAFWTFRALQYADSISGGKLFPYCVMMTGASGGMIGAAYWRSLHTALRTTDTADLYKPRYQQNISKDLLNSIVFSLASVDLISPFNKISLAGYSYTKDRGYAMEQEMIRNTDGVLDKNIGDYRVDEAAGRIPMLIANGTIINDGRRLMIAAQPITYLTQPESGGAGNLRAIDGVDFATLFKDQGPYNLRLPTALRMTSTFPYVLPVVKLPSRPAMNIMDAGLRDNFGMELAGRYLHVTRAWLRNNTSHIILLQVRDTREYEVFPSSEMNTLGQMLVDPATVIQNKWEVFQSYGQGYTRDYLQECFGQQLEFITLEYIPQDNHKHAALNFHLTAREQQDLLKSIYHPQNQQQFARLSALLNPR